MKKKLFIISCLVMTILVIGCDKKTNTNEKNPTIMEEVPKNLAGGWNSMEVNDKIEEIADFVVFDKNIVSKVIKITDASSQVVSGRNFSFKLQLENGEIWDAKVYENIKKEKKVTLFDKVK